MDSITLGSILTFLSGGVIGGFVGGATKFFWDKYLPDRITWRRQQQVDRERLMSQFRGPAIRAMHDLERRIYGTVEEQASGYQNIKQEGQGEYYINATTFQLAQCCAWMEILREKMGALDYAELETRLSALSQSLLGAYRPHFHVFLLEQREIGERMVSITNGELCCKGYSEFLDLLNREDAPVCFSHLRDRVTTMLDNWGPEAEKLVRIQHSLVDMVKFLDPSGRWIIEARRPDKLDAKQVIDKLQKSKLVAAKEADELRKQASEDGLTAKARPRSPA
ncbi:MAG: hypothetical protein QOH41_1944 [Blastocatellia bacterium]|nr:hypothetical protein [Blastocatellia bacterium]